jgi:hypothetical protein
MSVSKNYRFAASSVDSIVTICGSLVLTGVIPGWSVGPSRRLELKSTSHDPHGG